jgi:hypothetical protein
MSLSLPDYIRQAGVVGAPVGYKWDDEDADEFYPEDEKISYLLDKICYRGVVALSAGFAEWVAWRLSQPCDARILLQEIEAVLAGIIDWDYVGPLGQSPQAPNLKKYRGPECGPIAAAFYLLAQIVSLARKSRFSYPEASVLSELALYVVPDRKAYKSWRRSAIRRFTALYPKREDDLVGPPIPREALDTLHDYEPQKAAEYLRAFLPGLDPAENPFLRSSDEMVEGGFKGTPYALD